MDKSAKFLVAAWVAVIAVVLACTGYLNHEMDRKMEEMERKIEAGNAQLKVDLVKALK